MKNTLYLFNFLILSIIIYRPDPILADNGIPFKNYQFDANSAALGYHGSALVTLSAGVYANPALLADLKGVSFQYDHNSDPHANGFYYPWYQKEFNFYAMSYNRERLGTFAVSFNEADYFFPDYGTSPGINVEYTDLKQRSFSLAFGTSALNTVNMGASIVYNDNDYHTYLEAGIHDEHLSHTSDQQWLFSAGMLFKYPLLRFRTDLIDDEFRLGGAINQMGEENDTFGRIGLAYEISPVLFLPSLDSHFRPIAILFVAEWIGKASESDGTSTSSSLYDDQNLTSWGVEFGLGEIFYYRIGGIKADIEFDPDSDNSHGLGLRLPIDILTNDDWPLQFEYDRACPAFSEGVVHSFRLNMLLDGKLAWPF